MAFPRQVALLVSGCGRLGTQPRGSLIADPWRVPCLSVSLKMLIIRGMVKLGQGSNFQTPVGTPTVVFPTRSWIHRGECTTLCNFLLPPCQGIECRGNLACQWEESVLYLRAYPAKVQISSWNFGLYTHLRFPRQQKKKLQFSRFHDMSALEEGAKK